MCLNYQDSLLRGCSSRPYEVLLDRLFRIKRALYDLPMGKRKSTAFALLRERVRALPTRSISPCKEKKTSTLFRFFPCHSTRSPHSVMLSWLQLLPTFVIVGKKILGRKSPTYMQLMVKNALKKLRTSEKKSSFPLLGALSNSGDFVAGNIFPLACACDVFRQIVRYY